MNDAVEILNHPLTRVIANLEVRIKSIREDQAVLIAKIADDLNCSIENLAELFSNAGIK